MRTGSPSHERLLTAQEAAATTSRLALLGDPGSGKSTFVQQLTAQLARSRLGDGKPPADWPANAWPSLTLLRDLVPRLSDLPLADPPTPHQKQMLLAALQAQRQADARQIINTPGLPEPLPDLSAGEPTVLIFDGLDEVPERLRRHVRLAVQVALESNPAIARVIVTCRIRSYTGAAVLPDFDNSFST